MFTANGILAPLTACLFLRDRLWIEFQIHLMSGAAKMTLKQMFLSVSALAVLVTGAGAADMPMKAPRLVEQSPQQVSGYVEIYGGWARTKQSFVGCDLPGPDCESSSASVSGWTLGGAGRVTYWWAPNYSLQLDAQAEGTSHKFNSGGGDSFRTSSHSYLIGGHANWRDPQRGLIGIFGGVGDASNYVFDDPVRHGVIGAEGQVYWGPVTLYGQAGYNSTLGQLESDIFDSIQAWFVRGTARVYATPNFRLEGTVLYANGDVDFVSGVPFTQDFETWLWRAKAEYKFASSPFSIFATYEGSQTKYDTTDVASFVNEKFTDHRVMGGIRLYINENTLQWNDRNGTSLDIIAPFSVPSFSFPGAPL
jgi:hypothetical protein